MVDYVHLIMVAVVIDFVFCQKEIVRQKAIKGKDSHLDALILI